MSENPFTAAFGLQFGSQLNECLSQSNRKINERLAELDHKFNERLSQSDQRFTEHLARYQKTIQEIEAIRSSHQALTTSHQEQTESLESLRETAAHVAAELTKVALQGGHEEETENRCRALAVKVDELGTGLESSCSTINGVLSGLGAVLSGHGSEVRNTNEILHNPQAGRHSPSRILSSDETMLSVESEPHLIPWKQQGRPGTIGDYSRLRRVPAMSAASLMNAQMAGDASRLEAEEEDTTPDATTDSNLLDTVVDAQPVTDQQDVDFQVFAEHSRDLPDNTLTTHSNTLSGSKGEPSDSSRPLQQFQKGLLAQPSSNDESPIIRAAKPHSPSAKRKTVTFNDEEQDEIQFEGPAPRRRANGVKKAKKTPSLGTNTTNPAAQMAEPGRTSEDETAETTDAHVVPDEAARRSHRKRKEKNFGPNMVPTSTVVGMGETARKSS